MRAPGHTAFLSRLDGSAGVYYNEVEKTALTVQSLILTEGLVVLELMFIYSGLDPRSTDALDWKDGVLSMQMVGVYSREDRAPAQ